MLDGRGGRRGFMIQIFYTIALSRSIRETCLMGQVLGRLGMALETSKSESSQELLAISTEGEGPIQSKLNYRSMESESDSLRYRSTESGPQNFGGEDGGHDDFINVQVRSQPSQKLTY